MTRIREVAACRPAGIILREKDLSASEYSVLASEVLEICREFEVPCILHSFVDVGLALAPDGMHFPLPVLKGLSPEVVSSFSLVGASCHSVEDALLAQSLGCSYITAGHVFDTDCKRGLPGRGLSFLEEVCRAVSIPVFGLGGISFSNADLVRACGAAGVCVMSGAMSCPDPADFFRRLL